jgi:hypothetical protein
MRPRHALLLLLLAAIPIGLAIVLAGGGGTRTVSGGSSTRISMGLVGGRNGGEASACGAAHHYRLYPAGGTVHYQGTISARGHWTVKVKLKACRAGAFQSAGEASANTQSMTYAGDFPAPIAGYYFARAELKQGGAIVGRGGKAFFEIR